MKRIIIVLLIGVLLLSFPACGKNEEKKDEKSSAESVNVTETTFDEDGKEVEPPMINDELKTMFTALNKNQTGDTTLTPVAFVSAEVTDAGTDQLFLCKSKSNDSYYYVLVTVREAPDGEPRILGISSCGLTAPAPYDPDNPTTGGWGEPGSPEITDEVRRAFEKANKDHPEKSYEPIAYIGMQVVAGYNYHVLSRDVSSETPVYVILEIFSDLDGNAEIIQTYSFS